MAVDFGAFEHFRRRAIAHIQHRDDRAGAVGAAVDERQTVALQIHLRERIVEMHDRDELWIGEILHVDDDELAARERIEVVAVGLDDVGLVDACVLDVCRRII